MDKVQEVIENYWSEESGFYSDAELDIIRKYNKDLITFAKDNAEIFAGQSEWISVEDRLPEKNQQVLIYEHGRISETFYVRSHAKNPTHWETLPFMASHGYPVPSDWQSVTHWQPLPEPPEGE